MTALNGRSPQEVMLNRWCIFVRPDQRRPVQGRGRPEHRPLPALGTLSSIGIRSKAEVPLKAAASSKIEALFDYCSIQFFGCALAALLLLWAQAGKAHREHGVWTELIWSEDRFEITHHMHLQDAHSVLAGLDADTGLDSPEGLARLALYVEDRFWLVYGGETVSLDLLGAEAEGDFLYVFQEWPIAKPIEMPQIKSTLLEDIHPDAKTWVRIAAPGLNRAWAVGDPDSKR